MTDEVEQFCAVLRGHGIHPGGVHLEITPDDVSECVDSHADLAAGPNHARYRSACDPRLNPGQAFSLVERFTDVISAI
jgi:3-deoxy-7-phosphoheptulonate synthase